MTTRRFLRSVLVAATAGALLLSTSALPASARPRPGHGRGYEQSQKAHAKNQTKHGNRARGKAAEAKARKAARFQATGTLLFVSPDGTISVSVTGGPVKAWRGTIVDFNAAAAHVNRDDVEATLLDLVAGDHVAVKGMREDGVLVAKRVNAESATTTDTGTTDTGTTDTGTTDTGTTDTGTTDTDTTTETTTP